MADALRGDLVDGNAGTDIFARGFRGLATGQKDTRVSRVIARAVPVRATMMLCQSTKNQQVLFVTSEWRERPGQAP